MSQSKKWKEQQKARVQSLNQIKFTRDRNPSIACNQLEVPASNQISKVGSLAQIGEGGSTISNDHSTTPVRGAFQKAQDFMMKATRKEGEGSDSKGNE